MARNSKLLLLEAETSAFILASAMDFAVTFLMLNHEQVQFIESNPIAAFFLNHWGVKGLFLFKLAVVTLIVVICQFVARHKVQLARGVLIVGTAVVTAVVIYSVYLHQSATQAVESL